MGRKREPKWLQAARHGALPGKGTWLSRALGRAGVVPGGEVERAIHSGRVSVNGVLVREPLHPVVERDLVRFDGDVVRLDVPTVVLMFHKPAGSIVAASDPEQGLTVFDQLLPQLPPDLGSYRWHAIGRLDRATTGLLLFTSDEEVVERVTSPATHLPKQYVARVDGKPDDARLIPIRQGMTLDDGPTRPAQARLVAPNVIEIVITEGRHHQVRRMLNALGFAVIGLHRESVGGISLNVPEGGWRPLSREEVRKGLLQPGDAKARVR